MKNSPRKSKAQWKAQRGFMLLEALIAILIFSIGILALVGMQAATTKASGDAQYRTQASLLANELIGRMWVGNSASSTVLKFNFENGGTDYTNWLNTSVAGAGLPGVAVNPPTVVIDTTGTVPVATVTVFWKPPSEPAGDAPHQYISIAQIKK